ncbi:hypothetical protein [Lacticaseibacillus sp. 866-1]|uniref:hypothetical protein n=1 Tax=Lacticaseibacillus sp. 866-1 TaxID=2799576 RepID=UPI001944849F|nr:hypothetical protein [Lacticaseibacillus sp. 866-1]
MTELKLAQFALSHYSLQCLAEATELTTDMIAALKSGEAELAEMPYRIVHALAVVATGQTISNSRHIMQKAVTNPEGTLFIGELTFIPSELGDIRAWGIRASYAVARAICADAPDLLVSFVLMMMGRPYAFQALDQNVVLTEAMEAVIFNLQTAKLEYKLPDFVDKKGNKYYRILAGWHLLQDPKGGEIWARLATTMQSLEIHWDDHCSLDATVHVKMMTQMSK